MGKKISQITAEETGTLSETDVFEGEETGGSSFKYQLSVLKATLNSVYTAVTGWTPVSDTWTYASSSTITIPSDGTTTYRRGMKIRFKQGGGYKYYNCKTIAATLLTVVVNTDYTVANAAITDIAYSFAEEPLGFPGQFNFSTTATYSGGTTNPTSNTPSLAVYSVSAESAKLTILSALVRGGGDRTFTIFSTPFTAIAVSMIRGGDTITAAGLSSATTCYAETTSVFYQRTMANDGTYYINGEYFFT